MFINLNTFEALLYNPQPMQYTLDLLEKKYWSLNTLTKHKHKHKNINMYIHVA